MIDANKSYQIHILRVIGTFLIILAHVSPPIWLFELRNFDVVLMVAISTISYISFEKETKINRYLIKRAKRLILPTWIFILVSFIVYFIIAKVTNTATILPLKTAILGLFTFSGVGYLWVIRVYCYNAVINPFIKKNVSKPILLVLPLYIVYVLIYWVAKNYLSQLYPYLEITVIHFLGWAIVAIVGAWMFFTTNKKLIISIIVFAIVWLGVGLYRNTFRGQDFKYPPLTLYLSYGFMVCGLIFLLFRTRILEFCKKSNTIIWLSKNSLTIYFVHVILLNIISAYGGSLMNIDQWVWYLKFILIIVISVTITLILELCKRQIFKGKK